MPHLLAAVLCPWMGRASPARTVDVTLQTVVEASEYGSRLAGISRVGVTLCFLPEADDSSVFVVGTVLYRNLGSFLALQR